MGLDHAIVVQTCKKDQQHPQIRDFSLKCNLKMCLLYMYRKSLVVRFSTVNISSPSLVTLTPSPLGKI